VEMNEGILVVVSGPAGVGKGTICSALFAHAPGLAYSVSVTTRGSRPGETEGKEYYFRSRAEFLEMVENNELLEWAEFCGNYYGTPKFHVESLLSRKKTIILEIDIQGAKQVKKLYPEGVYIFIVPPSLEILSERLHGRGTEPEEIIQRRLSTAILELDNIREYDYVVENDYVDEAVNKIKCIIMAEKCSIKRKSFLKEEEEK